jgi:hypothetical protein
MAKEQIERVKGLLENVKISASIDNNVLIDAAISGSQVVSLIHQIDEIYASREHDLLTEYVSPDDARKAMQSERTNTFSDVDMLIKRLESYYKGGEAIEQAVVSRIKEDFKKLQNQE